MEPKTKTNSMLTNKARGLSIAGFVVICIGIVCIGIFTFKDYESRFRVQIEAQLSVIAELKVDQVTQWRKEKLGDANVIFNNNEFTDLVREYLKDPIAFDNKSHLEGWLEKYNISYQYNKMFLMDDKLNVRLTSPPIDEKISLEILANSQKALDTKEITFQDFYINDFNNKPYLALLVPILDYKNNQKPLGVLFMRIDPEVYLYPLIGKWPIPSDTGEALLVRQDGSSVLFLNNLRFEKDTALRMRIPLTDTIVPAVKATQGVTGIAEGRDYSGADVVSYLKPVTNSPWFIVVKISVAELNQPLDERLYTIVGFVVSMLAVSSIIFGMSLRQQRLYYYQEKLKADEGIRETKEFLESLFNYANAPIIVWDRDFNILRFNNAFQKLTGRSDIEVVGQHIKMLFPQDKVEASMQLIKKTEIGEKWETVEIKIVDITGKVFTVLWNSATIFSKDGTTPTATIAQGQDITERKLAEQKLEENLLDLKTLNQAMLAREMKMIELKKEIEELNKRVI